VSPPIRRTLLLIAAVGQASERRKSGMKKPPEPDAFADSPFTNPTQTVVPVSRPDQRQTMTADRKALIEAACAVFK
jgi:hypothetical protein